MTNTKQTIEELEQVIREQQELLAMAREALEEIESLADEYSFEQTRIAKEALKQLSEVLDD